VGLTINGSQPALDGSQSALDGPQPAVDGTQPAVDGPQSAGDGPQSAVDGPQSPVDGSRRPQRSLTIELNHRPYPYREGLTVSALMAENSYFFSHIIVKINGAVIEEETWPEAEIAAGDDVEMIHVFGGG